MGNHVGAPVAAPTPPRELPPPDIYREHRRAERPPSAPLLCGDGTAPRPLPASETRREERIVASFPGCSRSSCPKAARTCRAAAQREQPNRRASANRAPRERGETHRGAGLRRCGARPPAARGDVPDLFPEAEAAHGCAPSCPEAAGRLAGPGRAPRSPLLRLPSYREACGHKPRGAACASYVCADSSGHPLYLGRLPREHHDGPGGGRGSGRWDGAYRDRGLRGEPGWVRAGGTERLAARGVTSPGAGGSWRRVNSLESEV